jgi:hypothetical protein
VTVPPAILGSSDPSVQAGLGIINTAYHDYTLTRDQDVFLGKVDYQFSPNTA